MMPQQKITRPQMREVFGFQVPGENYYLHKGHAWVLPEGDDRVRVGLDDFSQKLLGPAELGQAAGDRQGLLSGSSLHGFVPAGAQSFL